jgi:hypothetical protein
VSENEVAAVRTSIQGQSTIVGFKEPPALEEKLTVA